MPELSIPSTSAEMTPEWLTAALAAEGVTRGASVTAVDATLISEGVGFVGDVSRLALTWDRPSPGLPGSLIAKVPTSNEGMRNLALVLGFYERENKFYEQAAGAITAPRIPRRYYTASNPAAGQFIILLEDLAPARPGNQLASCSDAEARMVIEAIARFHATWWQSPRLAEFAAWLPGRGHPFFSILEFGYNQSLPVVRDNFGHMIDERVLDIAAALGAGYQKWLARSFERPMTIVHNDFRLDNMMFASEAGGEPFVLLDWQLCQQGCGLQDVVYFLAGNFSPEWRRKNQHEMVTLYHQTLTASGVHDYPFEECWEDYRAAALVLVFFMVTGARDVDVESFNERGRELMTVVFERYSAAILDLEAAQFLQA